MGEVVTEIGVGDPNPVAATGSSVDSLGQLGEAHLPSRREGPPDPDAHGVLGPLQR